MKVFDIKHTSTDVSNIAAHYILKRCDGCPFFLVSKSCDGRPVNCAWIKLTVYLADREKEESKEEV